MKITNKEQLKPGMYLFNNASGRLHEILEVMNEKERIGHNTVCVIEYLPNANQRLSLLTAQAFELLSKESDPEYFL